MLSLGAIKDGTMSLVNIRGEKDTRMIQHEKKEKMDY
jgi:hypothetical protein